MDIRSISREEECMDTNYIALLRDGEPGTYDCIQYMVHPLVEKVICDRNNGKCRVIYKHGLESICDIGFDFYNSQYGVGISNDGERLFIGHWEYHKGLCCYSIKENRSFWKLKNSRNRNLFVYGDDIIVIKANTSVLKVDGNTGKVVEEYKSGTIDHAFYVKDRYVLVSAIRGKLALFDVDKMTVVKKYDDDIINPRNCLSLVINNATCYKGILTINGFEADPNGMYQRTTDTDNFIRTIDLDVNGVIKDYEKSHEAV